MSLRTAGVVPAVLITILALALIGASIPLPGGPLVVALALLAVRGSVRRRTGGAPVASVLLAAVVLALLVQVAILSSYAVSSGGDRRAPIAVPAS